MKVLGERFVRALYTEEELAELREVEGTDADIQDDPFTALAFAAMAAHHHELVCAACGSSEICRDASDLFRFAVLTNEHEHRYGYALCDACRSDTDAVGKLNAAFDRSRP